MTAVSPAPGIEPRPGQTALNAWGGSRKGISSFDNAENGLTHVRKSRADPGDSEGSSDADPDIGATSARYANGPEGCGD
jgi:hypothetical protein